MRFVLKRKLGSNPGGAPDVDHALRDVEVIDRVGDQAALIEASPEQAGELREKLPNWSVSPETSVPRPSPPFPRPQWKPE